eukprot:TRINITY_DN8024_c0_g1_i4.p1 TRINITY_DN8024_c0_g1~~TRINITY_DN8024_c0_g1_i4.p1  ORF type:complete len:339 (-),score=39.16 TRINITY_DN8024_c0_g1_i4:87-1103(-)
MSADDDVFPYLSSFGLEMESSIGLDNFIPSGDSLGIFSLDYNDDVYSDPNKILDYTNRTNKICKRERSYYHNYENVMDVDETNKRRHKKPKLEKAPCFKLFIEKAPPVEVRTRTPSEKRTFSVNVGFRGDAEAMDISRVGAVLKYSNGATVIKRKKEVLSGRFNVAVVNGRAEFTSLSICEASTKHGEQEFCLEFTPFTSAGVPLYDLSIRSPSFYAYSHNKVLARRKNIHLRTLNKTRGSFRGGEEMHVIGTPFIKGPSLRCVFDFKHLGKVVAPDLEVFSESVLFFRSPPHPDPSVFSVLGKRAEVSVAVMVSNDGRTFSNKLEYTYHYHSDFRRW